MFNKDKTEEKSFYFAFNRIHVYIVIGALFAITLVFFNKASWYVPIWPAIFFFAFCAWTAFDQWNEAIKRKGKGLITDLEISRGGHMCIHPEDIRTASRYDRDGKVIMSFACIAGGGYLFMGMVGIQGNDFFLVVPPEHIMDAESGTMIHTKLTKRRFDDFPNYIQSALLKLPRFTLTVAKAKDNIYFGMTSKLDGTATAENFAIEEKFCMMNKQLNDLKKAMNEYSAQLDKARREQQPQQPIIIQQPPQLQQ